MTHTLKYWALDKPIPEGWELASTLGECHHGYYSVLIREVQERQGQKVRQPSTLYSKC